ncbi:MAG: glucose-6-phosphate isomerase [Spirochaetia bacterium]
MINYKNLTETQAYTKLLSAKKNSIATSLSAQTVASCNIPMAAGLLYNYAAKGISTEVFSLLNELAQEQELIQKYRTLVDGTVMNTGENRRVLHHLCRGKLGNDVIFEGKNLFEFYQTQWQRVKEFANKLHNKEITGSTGQPFSDVVQIGIGGSDLGPRALCLALENLYPTRLRVHFVSNVDPDDAVSLLKKVNIETTLFILVSKSGTTQETLANYHFISEKAQHSGISGLDLNKHVIAVTSESSPLAKNTNFLASFFIDDFIGGRFSASSVVGTTLMSLVFGTHVVEEFLQGAHLGDQSAMHPNITQNAALLDALIGVYECNVMGYQATAVLPYSQALNRFPAHLQQLDMESNGKSVSRDGIVLDYTTGPLIFGEPGTNGQHSFYQLLHQGTHIVPLQFIGFQQSQFNSDVVFEDSKSQEKLNANLIAQIMAFAVGKSDTNSNKNFAGNRPSSLIYGKQLNAAALGALLSHYENKVMFQGFLWNINSFDQEGVQLGKVLTNKILEKNVDAITEEYIKLFGI